MKSAVRAILGILGMCAVDAPVYACAPEPLREIATELAGRTTPPSASELGPRLARACPRPLGLARALQAGDDPIEDREAAVTQAARWEKLCGDIASIPSGLETITPGQRMGMWSDCSLERFEAFEAHEWLATSGPAVSVVILAGQLQSVEALTAAERRTLIRGWAGIPEAEQRDPNRLQPFPTGPTPTIVKLAAVRWPPPTSERKKDENDENDDEDPAASTCLVEVDVVDEGGPNELRWVGCPEALRPYVESALNASWFEPGKTSGQPRAGTLKLTFVLNQPSGSVSAPDAEASRER